MDVIDEKSLYKTVINAAQVLFDGGSFNQAEKNQLATWILDHQNRHKGFVFFPSQEDRENGIRLFSGEKPRAKFLVENAHELETLRILALVQPEDPEVLRVFQEANERMDVLCFANGCIVGECAHACIAYRRYRMAFGGDGDSEINRRILKTLQHRRYGKGRWRDFPFYFTLLWLLELPGDMASEELAYARSYCSFRLQKLVDDEPFVEVRRRILKRVLDR